MSAKAKNVDSTVDLAEKIRLVRAGARIRVKEPDVSIITSWSLKKLQADRARGVGVPFIRDRGSIFYDLADVLKYYEGSR